MILIDKVPLGLYIHWPWCVRKCPYCDFNSHALRTSSGFERNQNESNYVKALKKDLLEWSRYSAGRPISSVFFGGGTPSLMDPRSVGEILDYANSIVGFTSDCEITLEANPGTIDESRFVGYKASGVNRLSIGIQSFDDERLKLIGRIHTSKDAIRAAKLAYSIFGNFNLDLMFGLPSETIVDLKKDLDLATALNPTHLSFYQLTIEEGTAFYKVLPENLPNDEILAQMSDVVEAYLVEEVGFNHYEVSGYARPGKECRHNLNYWTYGDYFGIGAGAHGKVSRESGIFRAFRKSNPTSYIKEIEKESLKLSKVQDEDIPFEFMLNALRLKDGVPYSIWNERTCIDISQVKQKVEKLIKKGLMEKDRIQASDLGFKFLSSLQEEFL